MRGNDYVLPEFIYAFVKTKDFLKNGERVMRGVAGQQRVPSEYVYQSYFPLPPLAEQERIVAKLEKLMKFCDELEANIKQGIKNADQLLQTALKEALEPK
jgi:type I restriction enzyme S subunit